MLWGLADRFVDEVVAVYGSRELAERALRTMLRDEPEWVGMIEVVSVPERRRCPAACRGSLRRRRRHVA